MKHWIVALTLGALCAPGVVVQAQDESGPGSEQAPPPPAPDTEPTKKEAKKEQKRYQRFLFPIEQVKDALGLSAEQIAKLEALNEQLRTQGQGLREMFQNGDQEGARAKMRELGELMKSSTGTILTEAQRVKLEELRAEMGPRRGRPGGEARGPGGRGPGGYEAKERLQAEALKALALSQEESAVIVPLLETVLTTRELLQTEGQRRRDEFLKRVRELDPGESEKLSALLAEHRKAHEQDQKTLADAEGQLRDVLTVRQEGLLLGLNVLSQ